MERLSNFELLDEKADELELIKQTQASKPSSRQEALEEEKYKKDDTKSAVGDIKKYRFEDLEPLHRPIF